MSRKITIAHRVDPIWEILLSLQEDFNPLVFGELRRRTAAALPSRTRLLLELARPWGYSPDFLTPGRAGAGQNFPISSNASCARPHTRLRNDLVQLAREGSTTPPVAQLAAGSSQLMCHLGSALTTYHEIALAPYDYRARSPSKPTCCGAARRC